MRGFLKNGQSLFQLTSKLTTIGREQCDLIIQSPSVDGQHAVIEYACDQQGFYLKDLKSKFGTTVNGYVLYDNVIKLAKGDKIKFGNSEIAFEFVTDHIQEVSNDCDAESVHTRLPFLKKCKSMQIPSSPSPPLNLNSSLKKQSLHVPRPPASRQSHQNSSFKRPILSAQNNRPKHHSLPRRNSASHALLEKEKKLYETLDITKNFEQQKIVCSNLNKRQLLNNLGKEIESLRQSVKESLYFNLSKEELIEEINNLKKELQLRDEETMMFKREIGRLRTSEIDHLTYRVDDTNEIAGLRCKLQETTSLNSALNQKLEILELSLKEKESQLSELENYSQQLKIGATELNQKNNQMIKECEMTESKAEELLLQLDRYKELELEYQSVKESYDGMKEKLHLMDLENKDIFSCLVDVLHKTGVHVDFEFSNIKNIFLEVEKVLSNIIENKENLSFKLEQISQMHVVIKDLKYQEIVFSNIEKNIEILKNIAEKDEGSLISDFIIFLEALKVWQLSLEKMLRPENSFQNGDDILKCIEALQVEVRDKCKEVDNVKNGVETLKESFTSEIKLVEERKNEQLEQLSRENERKIKEVLNEMKTKEEMSSNQIKLLQQIKENLKSENIEIISNYEKVQNDLTKQLKEQKTLCEKMSESLKVERSNVIDSLNVEIREYKEQVKQHSLTICSMENRLQLDLLEINDLKHKLENVQKKYIDPTYLLEENEKLKVISSELKLENNRYLALIENQQTDINFLKKELHKSITKLTDVSGELTEEQKQLMENQSKEVENQRHQLIVAKGELDKLRNLNRELEEKVLHMDGIIENLKKETYSYKVAARKSEEVRNNEKDRFQASYDQRTLGLTQQGGLCLEEKHDVIIKRQREAIAELRSKVKALELGDNPQEAVQQVAFLRREVEEMKFLLFNSNVIHQLHPSNDPAQQERRLADVLEISENLYLDLLKSVAKSLDLDEIVGTRSLLDYSFDGSLEALVEEKELARCQLTNLIRCLKDRVIQSDDLLHDYEITKNRLRFDEPFNRQLSTGLQMTCTEPSIKNEKVTNLRHSLRKETNRKKLTD